MGGNNLVALLGVQNVDFLCLKSGGSNPKSLGKRLRDIPPDSVALSFLSDPGQSPYPGKSLEKVLKEVGMGYRMPKPPNCPQDM